MAASHCPQPAYGPPLCAAAEGLIGGVGFKTSCKQIKSAFNLTNTLALCDRADRTPSSHQVAMHCRTALEGSETVPFRFNLPAHWMHIKSFSMKLQ